MQIAGRGMLVAGGAGSIGRAVVTVLRARGANVAVIDADPRAAGSFGDDAVSYVVADAADDDAAGAAMATIVARFGKIHALVNCVGLIHNESLVNLLRPEGRRHTIASWERVIRANLTTSFVVGALVAEHMAHNRIRGVIVNFSSVAAAGNAGQTAYSAAKAGVEAMTRVWARELGPLGIRAVAIAPGFVDTPSTQAALGDVALGEWKRHTALRRFATPGEIAAAVVFAIENDYVSGRTLNIDGGLSLT